MTTLQTVLTVAASATASGALAAGKHTPCDATGGALTMTLPTPARVGARLRVEKIDATANAVTVSGTIRGGASTVTLAWQYESVELFAESLTSWRVAAGHKTKASLDAAYAAPTDLYRLSSRRPAPPVTLTSGTQTGHAITVTTSGTGTWNLNDASDSMLGVQMVSLATSTTAETDSFKWTGTLDMTGKGFVFFFKASNQTAGLSKVDVQLPSGDGNYTGIVLGPAAYTADQQYAKEGEWVRYYVPFSMCTGVSYLGGTTGTTMARNAITSVRLRFWNKAGQVVTAGFAGFGTYNEPATTFPNGVISLTYDDIYSNQFTGARPALDKYGYRGTLFPILDRIDSGAGYMTSANIQYLHDRLGWEIGAHASTTAIHGTGLTGLSSAQRQAELKTIRDWQVANGYADGASFAYPRGAFDLASIADLGKWWDASRTTYAHCVEVVGTPYPHRLRSIVAGGPTLAQLKTFVDVTKQSRAWGVFTFHSIQPTTINDPTLDILQADHSSLIDYIATQGVAVLPVGEVMRTGVPV